MFKILINSINSAMFASDLRINDINLGHYSTYLKLFAFFWFFYNNSSNNFRSQLLEESLQLSTINASKLKKTLNFAQFYVVMIWSWLVS